MAQSSEKNAPWRLHLSTLWIAGLFLRITSSSVTNDVRDYCEGETFKARCSFDEVVVMQKAVYGRMRLDRCVKVDMGYLGCLNDVIDLADDKCSGRRSCEISIPDTTFELTQPCLELKSYLEASYECIKVLTVDSNECRKSKFLRANHQTGRIASVTAHETYCGTVDTPWLIQGSPGQRINLTLTDFNAQRRDADPVPAESCHKYATIVESGTVAQSVTVCGRRNRNQQIYVSEGHIVQVQIETRRVSQDFFIINYEVFGCSDPVVPNNAWFKRVNNEAIVGCRHTSEKWTIICDGNKWTGDSGNCTHYANIEIIGRSTNGEKQSSVILVAVLCIMIFLVTMIAILLSILLYRRYRRRRLPCSEHPAISTKGKDRVDLTYDDEEEELSSYVRPYKSHRYGRHHDHHHGHHHQQQQQQQQQVSQHHHRHHHHNQQPHRSRSDSIGSKATDYSANYEKVGSCKMVNKYTHIWEMPLPTPGE